MIKLYGINRGQGSWARVASGIRGALQKLGELSSFYDLSSVDNDWESDPLGEGYDSAVGIGVGPPMSAGVMFGRGEHKQRLFMIATNSSWLPAGIIERANHILTGFIGTSLWATQVIKRYADDIPVYTWPHGVEPDFSPPENYVPGLLSSKNKVRFSVLHLASTHMERKGTKELIHGWAEAKRSGSLDEGAILHLVVDGPRGYFLKSIFEASRGNTKVADSYVLTSRKDLTCAEMRDFYCQHHIVCQPSRGEGFGLVPLEARASGVPVIATACTGHADHMAIGSPGVIIVPHGDDAPVDDGPGALAPTVDPKDIAQALCEAAKNWTSLAEAASNAAFEVRRNWSWVSTTSNFLMRHREIFES